MRLPKILSMALCLAFLLGSYKGYLALWKEDQTDPFQIFPVKVSSLPESDQLALENGISAYSQGQLDRLLEDYLS